MITLHVRRRVCAPALALCALAPAAAAQGTDSVQAVDRVFQWANAGSPGCAVGVARAGRTLLTRAYGMASLTYGAPFTTETVSDAGSVSKQFTAAAVLLLAQEGRLSLDDPIRKYLPEVPDFGTPVTIRQMLSHSSGLRDWPNVAAYSGWPEGTAAYSNNDVLYIASKQRGLNFPPGSEFTYSNTNFDLLAILVERITGTRFAEFTRQRLFEPLGMSRTQWRDDYTRVVKGLATGYSSNPHGEFRENVWLDSEHGAGGLRTTVGDLLRWNEALAGGRVLRPEVVSAMETPVRLTSGATAPYGLGLWVRDYRGVPEIGHGGSWAGYRASLMRYPRQQLTVAVLCNTSSVSAENLGRSVADVFLAGQLPSPAAAAPPPRTIALAPGQLAARAGLYRDVRTGEPLRIGLHDGRLEFPGSNTFGGARLLGALSDTTFVMEGGGGRLDFQLGARGEVKGFRVRPTAFGGKPELYERVEEWKPSREDLAAYLGRYGSDEAGTTIQVEMVGEELGARLRAQSGTILTPRYRDAFQSRALGMFVFQRDAAGRVTGLTASTIWARGIVFTRQ